jgi:type II secretory pathway component PulF
MPNFSYKAKAGPSETVEGNLTAYSEEEALLKIEKMGYSPVSVHRMPEGTGSKGSARLPSNGLSFGVRSRDINIFTRQLSGMLKAGVPILKALATIRLQSSSAAFQSIIQSIENQVRDGKMLSESLAAHSRYFPELYISMVRSGETGGVLDELLLTMADAREQEEEFRRKVQSALAYPGLMLTVGIVTVFVMISFLLPRIIPLIEGGADPQALPGPTQAVIQISHFFSHHWYWVAGSFVFLGAMLYRLNQTSSGRRMLDGLKLKCPYIRRFIAESDTARFARTLSLLTRSAVPIDRALHLSGSTLHNTVLRDEIEAVRLGTVQQGRSIAAGLEKAVHFPRFVTNTVAVGEESGNLDGALTEIAVFYEREVDHRVRVLTALLEPLLILGIGAIVGFIVYAMMLPIFEIGRSLG